MDLNGVEQVKQALAETKTSIEATMQSHKSEYGEKLDGKAKEIYAKMEGDLAGVKDSIAKINEAAAKAAAMHVPGMEEAAKEWSWSGFVKGALMGQRMNQKEAFDKAGSGLEYEMLQATSEVMQRDHIAGDGTQGGYLIPEEVSDEIVGMTIAKMPMMEMGVTKMTGLVGDLPIPRISSRNTGYWVGETEPPTESTGAFAQFSLRPKKAGAFTKFSRRLSYQTRGVADQIIKTNVTDALALTIHQGWLSGLGTESQPLGLLRQTGTTTSTALGANGGRFRIDNAASMAQALDVANELVQGGNFGYIMRPEVLGGMKRERIPQFTGQALGQGQPINPMAVLMSQDQLEQVCGYKIRTTTQLSATDSKGTSSTVSPVIFGNFSQFYAGFWRGLEIRVSDVASDSSGNSAMLKDQFYMVAFQEVDCNVGRATAFTFVSDAECTESNWANG